jgi:hypothetical protein
MDFSAFSMPIVSICQNYQQYQYIIKLHSIFKRAIFCQFYEFFAYLSAFDGALRTLIPLHRERQRGWGGGEA